MIIEKLGITSASSPRSSLTDPGGTLFQLPDYDWKQILNKCANLKGKSYVHKEIQNMIRF